MSRRAPDPVLLVMALIILGSIVYEASVAIGCARTPHGQLVKSYWLKLPTCVVAR